MSTTIKVFIVINLVLALLFAFVEMTLFATNENWHRRWNEDTTEMAKDNKNLATRLADVSYEKTKDDAVIANQQTQINDLQATNKRQEAIITEKDKDISDKALQISKAQADIAQLTEDNRSMRDTLDQTRQRNNELTHIAQVARAAAFQLNVKMSELEDDFNNANTSLAQANENIAKLTKDLNTDKAKLAQVEKNYPDVWKSLESGQAKFIQGMVAAVKLNPAGKQELVMLSVGSNNAGVEEGMEFIVFRGNQYIVKVRAEHVLPDMTACRVIGDTWNSSGQEIKTGDMAQNRL